MNNSEYPIIMKNSASNNTNTFNSHSKRRNKAQTRGGSLNYFGNNNKLIINTQHINLHSRYPSVNEQASNISSNKDISNINDGNTVNNITKEEKKFNSNNKGKQDASKEATKSPFK